MKEKFLHLVWNYQLFHTQNLRSTDGEEIFIDNKGQWNYQNSGPDFIHSKIYIRNTLWAGNIEIHVKSSDWDLHKHSADKAYSNVVLHVVYEHDKEIKFLKERQVPTLELKHFVFPEVLSNYRNLLVPQQFIPCERIISTVSEEVQTLWLERIFVERLERKVNEIESEFLSNEKNWEQLLFKKLSYTFGLKINADAFLHWSNSFPFKVLQKIQNRPEKIHALFLGQAGFLDVETKDTYIESLQNEYRFLISKYNLKPVQSSGFKFFRLRPSSFPTVRIAQLASVYSHYPNLFSYLMGSRSAQKIHMVFKDLDLPEFWENHYVLEKESLKKSNKQLTAEFIDKIIINVIVPLKFFYARSIGKDINDELIDLFLSLPAEKNKIIEEFGKIGLNAQNAFESQAYLELKKYYCDAKNCLNCNIGLQVLKNV